MFRLGKRVEQIVKESGEPLSGNVRSPRREMQEKKLVFRPKINQDTLEIKIADIQYKKWTLLKTSEYFLIHD